MKKRLCDFLHFEVFCSSGKYYIRTEKQNNRPGIVEVHPVDLIEGIFFARKNKKVEVLAYLNEETLCVGYISTRTQERSKCPLSRSSICCPS